MIANSPPLVFSVTKPRRTYSLPASNKYKFLFELCLRAFFRHLALPFFFFALIALFSFVTFQNREGQVFFLVWSTASTSSAPRLFRCMKTFGSARTQRIVDWGRHCYWILCQHRHRSERWCREHSVGLRQHADWAPHAGVSVGVKRLLVIFATRSARLFHLCCLAILGWVKSKKSFVRIGKRANAIIKNTRYTTLCYCFAVFALFTYVDVKMLAIRCR